MQVPDQPPGSVLLGYAYWLRNSPLQITLCGTPRELIGSLTSEPSFREVYQHPHTTVESIELFQVGPRFTMRGGPHAELLLDLIDATDRSDLPHLTRLLKGHPRVWSNFGTSAHIPLHHAVGLSRIGFVKALLEHRAPIDARGQFDMTALHWAAAHGNLALVDTLLSAGADATAMSWFMLTPAETAALNGHRRLGLTIASGPLPRTTRSWNRVVIRRTLHAAAA